MHACAVTLHAGPGCPVLSAAQCEVMDEEVWRKNKKKEIDIKWKKGEKRGEKEKKVEEGETKGGNRENCEQMVKIR